MGLQEVEGVGGVDRIWGGKP